MFLRQKGFTLIETVLYVGLVSLVLVAISHFALNAIQGKVKANVIQEVNQTGRFIVKKIAYEARRADSITSISSDTLVLSFPTGDDITFNFDSVNKKLTMQVGAGSVVDLTTNEVEITGGAFTDRSTGHSNNIKVSFIVSYTNPENLQDYDYSRTFESAFEMRADE